MWNDTPPKVVWTRGAGCGELADLVASGDAIRVSGDLDETVIRQRADLVVSRRLGSTELVSSATPVDFDGAGIRGVVAAVAGGPHSQLAAEMASRLGSRLRVPAVMACAHRGEEDHGTAMAMVERLYAEVPTLEYRLIQAEDASGIIAQIPEGHLLVLGAPGGNWLQRTLFGQGARLRQRAPAGAVIVRRAPRRAFHVMADPVFVGPFRTAADVLRLHDEPLLAVVDRARLIGVVHRAALELAPPGAPVQEVMMDPVSVDLTEDMATVEALRVDLDGAPIPVTDDHGLLVGTVR